MPRSPTLRTKLPVPSSHAISSSNQLASAVLKSKPAFVHEPAAHSRPASTAGPRAVKVPDAGSSGSAIARIVTWSPVDSDSGSDVQADETSASTRIAGMQQRRRALSRVIHMVDPERAPTSDAPHDGASSSRCCTTS